jgi:hypothetical protein
VLELVLLLPSNPVLPCRAARPSSGPLCCCVWLLLASRACEGCGRVYAQALIEGHGLATSYVEQPERLDVDVACYQTDLKYPMRRERRRSLESFSSSREVQGRTLDPLC